MDISMLKIGNLAILCAGFWVSGVSIWCQDNRATLGGRVIDPQNAVVPGAAIDVISSDTRVRQKTVTNSEGEWKILFLNPGRYTISVSAQGFKTAERTNVELQTADIKQVDITLSLGSSAETVTVTA